MVSLGTFGWWGAWLAGGDVAMSSIYHQEFEPSHRINVGGKAVPADYYPSRWVNADGIDIRQHFTITSTSTSSSVRYCVLFMLASLVWRERRSNGSRAGRSAQAGAPEVATTETTTVLWSTVYG